MMKFYLLLPLLSITLITHAQKEIELVGESGDKHKLVINWDDPGYAPKWMFMALSPGFVVGGDVAITNRFEFISRPNDKLDIQARLSIPYHTKTDMGRERPEALAEQTASTIQTTLKIGYSLFSKESTKTRKTQVGGSGNVAYVAEIPRTLRNGVQVVGGYDYYRSPNSYQVDLITINQSAYNESHDFYCMNASLGNVLGGLAFTREQSYGVELDGNTLAFGTLLKAYFLVAANTSHSSDIYMHNRRLEYDSPIDTNIETNTVQLSTNDSINNKVSFNKKMGIRMGADYFISRPNASFLNVFFFGAEIATLPYFSTGSNKNTGKGYFSAHFGYGFGQKLKKK